VAKLIGREAEDRQLTRELLQQLVNLHE